jgi:hypothetical protein
MNQIIPKNSMNEAINASRPSNTSVLAPAELRELQGWLIWRFEQDPDNPNGKPLKVPYYADGGKRHGKQGGIDDRGRMTTFAAARDAAARRGFTGVGLALMPEFGITALDFDNCVDAQGKLPPEIEQIASQTYAEYSPSGKGIRAFVRGSYGNRKSETEGNPYGFETFSSKGFVTFTGNAMPYTDLLGLEDTVADLDTLVAPLCAARFGAMQQRVSDPDDFMAGREPKIGLTVSQMEELLSVLDADMPREDWIRVGMALHHECDGDDTGFEIWNEWSENGEKYPSEEGLRTQWDSFERRKGSGQHNVRMATVMMMAKEAGYLHNIDEQLAVANLFRDDSEWPEPAPLSNEFLSVPSLDSEMLPSELQPWLSDVAARMSVPLDFAASAGLSMLGALIGRKIVIKPEKNSNWSEPANLWGCIVASPGALKSPAIREVFAPLAELEAEAMVANKQKLKDYEMALAVHKVKQASAEKKAKETGDPAALMQAYMAIGDPPEKPKFKRYFTSNATVEKLGEMCADNPNGVMYHRDELLSLLADLDRKEKAADRGFLMTGWSGLDAYTFDRIGRGTTYVPSVTISMFGTTQPSRIANYVSGSLASFDDGMVQRLQILVWPDNMPHWVPMDRPSDKSAQARAFQMCRRLAELRPQDVGAIIEDGNAVPYLRFTEEARRLFVEYRTGLETKVRGNTLSPELAAHLSKYRGLVPRIALILHLASGGTGSVSAEAITMAIRWADYLEAHARRVYAAAAAAPVDTAKLIWKRIESKKLKCGFTVRDIYTQGWSQLKDKVEIERGLGALVNASWLAMRPEATRGRPIVRYYINPKTSNLKT